MDVRKWTHLFFRVAAGGSLVLAGSAVVLAGDRHHEQPTRPHSSAANSPNWGYNQTCWSRFPAVPDCPGNSREFSPEGYGYESYPSQPIYYGPQNATMMQEQRAVSPEYGFPNSPINVYPNTSPASQDQKSGGAAAPTASGHPQIPDPHTSPSPPVPGAPSTLPPLPAPPLPAPGQSSFWPNMTGPDRQMVAGSVSASGSTLQTGARYAIPVRSGIPVSASAPVVSGSYAGSFVSNAYSPSAASSAQPLHRRRRTCSADANRAAGVCRNLWSGDEYKCVWYGSASCHSAFTESRTAILGSAFFSIAPATRCRRNMNPFVRRFIQLSCLRRRFTRRCDRNRSAARGSRDWFRSSEAKHAARVVDCSQTRSSGTHRRRDRILHSGLCGRQYSGLSDVGHGDGRSISTA